MGTRSLTFVYGENNEPLLNVYRQFDGYPEGHGLELATFLNSFDAIVNGIPLGDKRKLANGMGCLAAQFISEFKSGAGGIYIFPFDSTDCGQEYEYHVYTKTVGVKDSDGKVIFVGSWIDFLEYCKNPVTEE